MKLVQRIHSAQLGAQQLARKLSHAGRYCNERTKFIASSTRSTA